MAFQLLRQIPRNMISETVCRLGPWLHIDFLSRLPFEVCILILSFTSPETLKAVERVSRRWRELAHHPLLAQVIFLRSRYWYNVNRVRRHQNQTSDPSVLDDPPALLDPSKLVHPIGKDHWDEEGKPMVNWRSLLFAKRRMEQAWRSLAMVANAVSGAHREAVYCAQFQGDRLVSGGRDCQVKVWDLPTNQCLRSLSGHCGSVLCLQFDPAHIFTGGSDSMILQWDSLTGERVGQLEGHEGSVLGVRFNREFLVSCSKDKTVRLWDRASRNCLRTMRGHEVAVNAVQFSLRHNLIASGSGDRTIRIWDLERGDGVRTMEGHGRGVACLEFDGRTLITGASDSLIKLWDVRTGGCIRTLEGHESLVRTLAWDGLDRIVSGSYDQTVKVWDLRGSSSAPTFTLNGLRGHYGRIFKVQFDATRIVSCYQGGSILSWSIPSPDIPTDFLV
ncbi:WD40-repeat-containing domain protein [Piptocephalis cylindrospora]|uniref:WD40-repeat-containing domain protein n=1 Tax=Piptocephalis cylindrospora TaxID=1907219 RepID=A0A4P9XZ99_9FUNG|nr:WD40-repeat-containing domain protein [Piptocephalis cylindrospora]|eukprot:RKP11803.1 WD40-repeat-containing domain protein [Piptocephalis cylindrospora]